MRIEGKIVVVTGGLSGLGHATVQLVRNLGAYVAVMDLQLPRADHRDTTEHVRYYKADVSNPQDVQAATKGIIQWSSEAGLDIAAVVCCAGFLGPAKVLSKKGSIMALDVMKRVIDISLIGTLDVIRHLAPKMASQQADEDGERGVLITVSSAAAFDGQEGQVAYSAAKGGLASMTLPLARDLASFGIRAVCIAPAMFGTNMVAGMPDKVKESLSKSLEFPKRAGAPEEFASLVKHVMENKMLNGTVIRLDGAARLPSRL